MSSSSPPAALEAKIVVLGSQGVGKTTLVHRYVKNAFLPPSKSQSTVGASFLTTRVSDPESGATIRLQIWDTAGQERFRSISKLYYRGAHAAILCYDVSSTKSFDDMGRWLRELRRETDGQDMILHVVGTKSDVVREEPHKRQVPFERCIGYVAEHLYPEIATGPATSATFAGGATTSSLPGTSHGLVTPDLTVTSPNSNRTSGFWGQEVVWDCCHEVSAKDGEGIEEVFRVITRKLVEQHQRRNEHLKFLEGLQSRGRTPGVEGAGGQEGYFDMPGHARGSVRLGHGDKRRSWLGFPSTPGGLTSYGDEGDVDIEGSGGSAKRCC